ncbi:MAG: glycoside hydrolase family 25 protein [Lachnospiraceae bacterium]|nr:glycoside hydrolase family 25 protein [Lachnospiraceae bacterium]
MDSRLKKLSIIGCLGVVVLLLIIVVYSNGGITSLLNAGNRNNNGNDGTGTSVNGVAGSEGVVGGTAVNDSGTTYFTGQVGDNLNGFLADPTFFDQERNEFLENAGDMSNRLSILATSVEKDLRVQVIDYGGELVKDISFTIRITDASGSSSEYRDLDKDGVIYAGSLRSGDYQVQLLPLEGYKVPTTATTVRVKERVEYVVIDDIKLLIKTEAEIDAEAEDTAVAEAAAEADKNQMVKLKAGGTRQKVGIDVSKYQGDIDWDKVAAAGVQFVIIRAGYRGSVTGALVEDPNFVQNIRGALAAGLEVGVYFFTQAVNETEAVEEASAVVSMVREYDIKLPIYIDTEGAGGNGRADGLDVETRTKVCDAFCRTAVNAGYNAGVYASRSWLYHNLDTSVLDKYEIWNAEWVSVPQYTGYYTMWQYSSKGSIDGIVGNVDLDIYYY